MLHFSKFKTVLIWAICGLGILFSLPNFFKPGTLPDWIATPRLHLGLDLQGGAYLLLQVDSDALVKERLEGTVDAVRGSLREGGFRYRDLGVRERSVVFALLDASQEDAVRTVIAPLLGGTPAARDFTLGHESGRFTLTLTEAAIQAAGTRAVEQSVEIVRRRIDETGVNEPVVARQGSNRILLQLPGIDDPSRIKRLLGHTAKMSFHLLAEDAGRGAAPPGTKVELDGARLRDASANYNSQSADWVVHFTFDTAGAKRFAEITKANVGKPFAIVLDGKVISAPVIREPITGGQGQISGSFTVQSAHDLAVLLRAGALPAPLTIVEERSVGPDLGADAIRAGIIACAVGFALVVGYMGLTYGLFGLFANIALLFNLALTLAALSLLQATLTLPGIAGILLTLGLSVDANILINERIREETRKGVTPIAAMDAGFSRAFSTILTIMGYSINDKVVVYDRVRENLRLFRKMPLRELIDRSINETLSRTVSTSLAIFLATLPLALFGGEALQEFALVLLFGVVLATSSSIFIAAHILLFLGEHRLRRSPEEDNAPAQAEAAGS